MYVETARPKVNGRMWQPGTLKTFLEPRTARYQPLLTDCNDQALCLCPTPKCIAGIAFLRLANGSFKPV
jgi:hypothetical protein